MIVREGATSKVLKGETPDRVPWFADLGHWYRAESGEMWNLFEINNCTGDRRFAPGG